MTEVTVRLSVTRIDVASVRRPGELLLDVEEKSAVALERASAWAAVRGYDRLAVVLEDIFAGEPPAAGYAAVINKPHGLLIFVTWPWAPETPLNPR